MSSIIFFKDTKQPGATTLEQEKEADCFARDTLNPPEYYQNFIAAETFSRVDIVAFADGLGIYPGIVLGRLQKDGHVPFNRFSDLKKLSNSDAALS